MLGRYSRTKPDSTVRKNGFLVTGVSCMVSEAVVNLLGVVFLMIQIDPEPTMPCDVDTRVYKFMRGYGFGIIASTMIFPTALIFPLWWCAVPM